MSPIMMINKYKAYSGLSYRGSKIDTYVLGNKSSAPSRPDLVIF